MKPFTAVKNIVLDLIFPVFCARCGNEGAYLCPACSAATPTIAPSCFVCKKLVPASAEQNAGRTCKSCRRHTAIHTFFSPYSYGDPVIRTLIHRLKYQRMRGIASELAALVASSMEFYSISLPRDTLIIPIPLHKTRLRMRGFNQAWLIAQALGIRTEHEARKDILIKIKKTSTQMGANRDERLDNLEGAFTVSDTDMVRHRTCVLVDDVKTTGATLAQAALALRKAGARRIWAVTVAH